MACFSGLVIYDYVDFLVWVCWRDVSSDDMLNYSFIFFVGSGEVCFVVNVDVFFFLRRVFVSCMPLVYYFLDLLVDVWFFESVV